MSRNHKETVYVHHRQPKLQLQRNNSHGVIIRVCMGIFTAALRNKIIRQILKKKYLTLLLHSWSLGHLCVHLWGLWEQEYLQECKECEIWTKETESQHWTKMAAREGKEVDFSQIKNKQRRSSLYQKEKLKKAKEKRDRKRKRKQDESQEEGEVRQWKKKLTCKQNCTWIHMLWEGKQGFFLTCIILIA